MASPVLTNRVPSERTAFQSFFAPASIAVVGATDREGSVGRTVVANLVQGSYKGRVYPVNRKHPKLFGVRCYPNPESLPEPIDLAVIVTPAPTVPGVVRECVAAGVPGAIVISAGFKESGEEGAALEREILSEARRGQMRIIGPNCLGVMSPLTGLNATFASAMARPGSV